MRVESACILGGTGFVGRALAEHLCGRGVRVRVVTRRLLKSRPLWVLPTAEVVVADPHDEVALAAALEGSDAAVNLCGILHETRGATFESVHAELPRKVVGACRAAGVRHLVHMSALGASAEGPSDYQRSKARGEAAVRENAGALPFTIFRPSVIFGEGDNFLNLFARLAAFLPVVPLASAKSRVQPVWVEDVARAMAGALGDGHAAGKTYELCGPQAYTLEELVTFVADATGRKRWIVPLPAWAAQLQALVLEHLPGKMLTRDNLKSLTVDNVCASPFPRDFGFQPAPLESIVPAYLAGATARARYDLFRHRAGR
jgi:NADH dehydrogenase